MPGLACAGLLLLAAPLGADGPLEARIEGHRLLVNGEPYVPFGMIAHCSTDEYARLAELGVNSIHHDAVYLNFDPQAPAEKEAERIAGMREVLDEAHRNGQTVLMQLGFHYVPKWLFERYSDARMIRPDGTPGEGGWHPFCLDHPGMRQEMRHYIEATVRALKDHPALLTWCLWNEPHLYGHVCYSKFTLDRFRAHLEKKYGSIDALNRAWGTNVASFDKAEAPAPRDEAYWDRLLAYHEARADGEKAEAPAAWSGHGAHPIVWDDWARFRMDNYADFFRWEADTIRQFDPDHPITTKIVPFDSNNRRTCSRAVHTRRWARGFCDAVGFDGYHHLDDNVAVRLYADFMRDMSGGKPAWNTEAGFTWADQRGRPSPAAERSAFWMQFSRGVTGKWHFFWSPKQDFWQRYTYPDGSVQPGMFALQECSRQVRKHRALLCEARVAPAQVAILLSRSTGIHQTGDDGPDLDLSTVIQCLYRRHIPFNYVTEEDVAAGHLSKFRALVAVGAIHVADDVLANIERFAKQGGHVLANARFAEFDERGVKRDHHPPVWMGARARQWQRSARRRVGELTLDRRAIDIHEKPVEVKVRVPAYSSLAMTVTGQQPGLPDGTVIGTGPYYGQGTGANEGRGEQMREDLEILAHGTPAAVFDDGSPAIVTTAFASSGGGTVYIGRDTCWMNEAFANAVEGFILHAGVTRKARAVDGEGRTVSPLDLVLCQTPTKWVLYANNSPRTLHYDGSPLRDVRITLPVDEDPVELLSGRTLSSTQRDGLRQVTLDFEEGETKILVGRKASRLTFRDFSAVNMATSTSKALYRDALGMNRLEILWAHLEPKRGAWNDRSLESYGKRVLEQNRNGVGMLTLLAYGAPWSAAPKEQVVIGSHPAYISKQHIPDWVAYVERVVRYLRKPPFNVEYFQVWNEPWEHPQCGFWGGSEDEFFTHVYLPAAAKIRELGGKVVYGGWPSCCDLSVWVGLLDRHRAWDDTDVLSFHYQFGWYSVWAWDRMRPAAARAGFPDMSIWTTEVGAVESPAFYAAWYTKLLYWAALNGGGQHPDRVKTFYFKEEGDEPGSYHHDKSLYNGDRITPRGKALQAMADVFGGGAIQPYTAVTNDRGITADISPFGHSASAVESFRVTSEPARLVTGLQILQSEPHLAPDDRITLTWPRLSDANRVARVERIDVAGHATPLQRRHAAHGMSVEVPIANDAQSPAGEWGVADPAPFFVVVTLR